MSDWSSDVCSSDLAHIILERYVTCRTGNIDRRAARCDLGHTGSADRAYVVGGRERGSHNRAGRSVRNHAEVAVHLINAIVHELLQRSEEHTSELQSLMRISYAVFCLKKKTKDK